jgi:hypothetical protein
MWMMTIWRLMWEMWTSAPRGEESCNQGRGACRCREAKHG